MIEAVADLYGSHVPSLFDTAALGGILLLLFRPNHRSFGLI